MSEEAFGREAEPPSEPPPGRARCGFVALIGAPNAGKSTLLNQLLGTKLSIVTHKVQTTRMRVRGVAVRGDAQVIFVDTPGIFAPRRRLERALVQEAWSGVADADLSVLLVDAVQGFTPEVDRILEGLKETGRAVLLALNKVDVTAKPRLLDLARTLNGRFGFREIFMISALTGDGVGDLARYLAEAVPKGPWLYPSDQLSDLTDRLLAAEITREKLFLRLHDELPYELTVETETWKTLQNGSVRIEQVIYVARNSQKPIVLGKGGRTIKEVGQQARAEMEELFGHKVHLFLFVKVREKWRDDPERYREMGIEFPTE